MTARKHRMDLRGLTLEERQVGAIVRTGRGTYRVVEIKNGTAVMEPLCSDCPPTGYPTDKTRCSSCPRVGEPTVSAPPSLQP